MTDPVFDVRHDQIGDCLRVDVDGELTVDTEHLLGEAIAPRLGYGITLVWIDLSAVTFCDSSGLRSLLDVQRRVDAAEATLVLRRPAPVVRRVLEVTGLLDSFGIEDDPPEPGTPS